MSTNAMLMFVLVPTLVVTLLRPNVGPAPAWLERWLEPLPPSIRGATF